MAELISKRIAVIPRASEEALPADAEGGATQVNRNLIFVAVILAFVFIGCSLSYVWSHHQIIALGYEASQAAREEQELLQENKRLRLELAALKSPARIERMASRDLGLGTPQKEQLIIVR
jgi:cell division protein FtsL